MPSLEIPGILRADELVATVDTIAALQLPNGMIPWFAGGHADPWNHVEAAMALLVGGRRPEAERAFDWLMRTQRPDGAWHHYYLADRVEQDKLEANVTAYVAAGVWHHWLLTHDRGFLESLRGELLPYGIHVGCSFPPDTDTPQLADENQYKPKETHAISGTIKPLSAEKVAKNIIEGIEKERFAIVPDVATRALAKVTGLLPGVVAMVMDRSVKKAQTRS